MVTKRAALLLPLIVAAAMLPGAGPAAAAATYTVTATIPVRPGPTRVAVDPVRRTVYVTHYSDGTVTAIDENSNTVIASIPVGREPEGVAVDSGTGTAYVANSGDTFVSVIDESTNTVTGTIPVGGGPYGVAVDPLTHTVYVTNLFDDTVSVIDGTSHTVTATIPVGNGPYNVAVDPGTRTAYVTNSEGDVSVIDLVSNTVVATIPVESEPYAVAIDPGTGTVYVTNYDGYVSVIDERSNTVITTVPVGSVPEAVAVDPGTRTVYVTADDGVVSVIDENRNTVTATVPVGAGLTGAEVDPTTHQLYVAGSGNTVSVITPYEPPPQQPQTVMFTSTPPSPATVGGTYPVSASGGGSGNPVIFSIDATSTAGACTVSASASNAATVRFTGPGSCVIDADQAGNDSYLAAPTARQPVTVVAAPTPTQDVTVSIDQPRASSTIVSPRLTTTGPGELIVAYLEADGPQAPTQQVTGVAGGNLTWRLAVRSNSTWGTTEVWYAYATGTFSSPVGAAFKYAYDASMTVVAYKNAAATPTAARAAAGISGRSAVTVTPTKAGSLIVASAHNWTVGTAPKPAAGQTLLHSYSDKRVHDAYWVQTATARTAGTPPAPVTLADTIPANSRWTMAGVEISGP